MASLQSRAKRGVVYRGFRGANGNKTRNSIQDDLEGNYRSNLGRVKDVDGLM
jgi:hypothetical protein